MVGLFCASEQGQNARSCLVRKSREQAKKLEGHLHTIESQLSTLEKQIQFAGDQLAHRLQEATYRAVGHYVPAVPESVDTWALENGELTRDLRRMPHG